MKLEPISLRTFIGSKDFNVSRAFYNCLGFEESVISDNMSRFYLGDLSFYLQDYYAEEWVNNTMLFIEVKDTQACFEWLKEFELGNKFPGAKLMPIKKEAWGEECFVLDPSGVLLHFGQFY